VNKKLILNNLLLVCLSETQNSLKVSIPHRKEIKLYWFFIKYKVKKLKLGSKGTQVFRGERFQVKWTLVLNSHVHMLARTWALGPRSGCEFIIKVIF